MMSYSSYLEKYKKFWSRNTHILQAQDVSREKSQMLLMYFGLGASLLVTTGVISLAGLLSSINHAELSVWAGLIKVSLSCAGIAGFSVFMRKKMKINMFYTPEMVDLTRQEMLMKENLRDVLGFLWVYVSEHSPEHLTALTAHIEKIKNQNFTQEDMYDFIELNRTVLEHLSKSVSLEPQSIQVKEFFDELNLQKDTTVIKTHNKAKYLDML